jgi:hypothetical protein
MMGEVIWNIEHDITDQGSNRRKGLRRDIGKGVVVGGWVFCARVIESWIF